MLLNPKTLNDAKTIIDNTVSNAAINDIPKETFLEKIGLTGVQEAIDGWNTMCSDVNNIIDGMVKVADFIRNCFTDPRFLIDTVKGIAPDILLITLGVLILLHFIGFKKMGKWINFILLTMLAIALL